MYMLSFSSSLTLNKAPMEVQTTTPMARSEVDTTRPFRSVKEAVAVFGDRIISTNSSSFKTNTIPSSSSIKANADNSLLAPPEPLPILVPQTQNILSDNTKTTPKLNSSPKLALVPSTPSTFCSSPINKPMYSAPSSPPSYNSSVSNGEKENENGTQTETENIVFSYLRRLESDVAETKKELNALKKRESEMEMALASLNAQLNRNLVKLSEIEASKDEEISVVMGEKSRKVRSNKWEEEAAENSVHYEYIPSLADALSLRDFGDEFGFTRTRKAQKMKPIVPLVGDIFSRKKSKENNSLYSESIYSVLG